MKHYLRLRHQLLPYLCYRWMWQRMKEHLVSPMYYLSRKRRKLSPCQEITSSVAKVDGRSNYKPMNKDYQLRKFAWFPKENIWFLSLEESMAGRCGAWYYRDIESIPIAKEGCHCSKPVWFGCEVSGFTRSDWLVCIPRELNICLKWWKTRWSSLCQPTLSVIGN